MTHAAECNVISSNCLDLVWSARCHSDYRRNVFDGYSERRIGRNRALVVIYTKGWIFPIIIDFFYLELGRHQRLILEHDLFLSHFTYQESFKIKSFLVNRHEGILADGAQLQNSGALFCSGYFEHCRGNYDLSLVRSEGNLDILFLLWRHDTWKDHRLNLYLPRV